MAERGDRERTVRRGVVNEVGGKFFVTRLVQTGPFGEG